jgi:hypothetical protein
MSGSKEKVELHAKVRKDMINFKDTYYANILNNNECEITLYPNTPLTIVSVKKDGSEIDLSNIRKNFFS